MINIYREEDGKFIKGIGLPAFIHNVSYYQTIIEIYEDGIIDCWGYINIKTFEEKLNEGWVTTEVPKGANINKHHLFSARNVDITTKVENKEFLKEVKDALARLQGEKGCQEDCWTAFMEYIIEPNDEKLDHLKECFEAVPKHLRRYLHDMDDEHRLDELFEEEKHSQRLNAYYKNRYLNEDGTYEGYFA